MDSHFRRRVETLIFNKQGQILLGKIPDSPGKPGFYTFCGGGIEKGQTAEDAVKAEALEELGVALKNLVDSGRQFTSFGYKASEAHKVRERQYAGSITYLFYAEFSHLDESIYGCAGDKLERHWVSYNDALKLLNEGIKYVGMRRIEAINVAKQVNLVW